MNNLAMSTLGNVPATQSLLNHATITPVIGGYSKWFSLDTSYHNDYLVYWNASANCAYMLTNVSKFNGAITNIYKKYSTVTGPGGFASERGPLGLPTSNFYGDPWGVSWQRFTNGYITSRSTGSGDLTDRSYYVGGSAIEDKALAARYGQFFDYPSANGINSYPLVANTNCTNSTTQSPDCGSGNTGRFTMALGPSNDLQTILARNGSHVAFSVGGPIAVKWRSAFGSTQPWNGKLGFPRSDEVTVQGVVQQNFDNGYITASGTITTPISCLSCTTSPSSTTCWDSTRGIQLTCAAATCDAVCNYASQSTEYCLNEGFNSTCGAARLDSLHGDCLHDPGHAGCAPLAMSNYQTYGICNDGSAVPVVPNVATRSWTQLSGPPTTPGTEQYNINALMNQAAALVGCNYDVDHWTTTDTSTNSTDASTYAYYKTYGKRDAQGNTDSSCAAVYFNRALGCAFPLSISKYPPGTSSVAVAPTILQEWNTFGIANLGLPTSLPHRNSETDVLWQRFQAGYITTRVGDIWASVAGGDNILGTNGEGRILAQRFGEDFDYYDPYALVPSLIPDPLTSSTSCNNPLLNHGNQCSGGDGLQVTAANEASGDQTTYWEGLGQAKAVATKGSIETKFSSLRAGSPQFPNSPTASALGWPLGEQKHDGDLSYQRFVGGRIFAKSGQPAYVVSDLIARAYERLDGVKTLGYPLEDTPNFGSSSLPAAQRFANGDIHVGIDGNLTVAPDPDGPHSLVVAKSPTTNGLPILLAWYNDWGTQQSIVYRQINGDGTYYGTGWTIVNTNNSPPIGTMEQWQDPTAVAGAKNCYFVKALPGGSDSNISCTRARDRADRFFSVARAEIRIRVANVDSAGTDDGVTVRLSADNSTHIDSPIDDFQRNSNVTYGLIAQDLAFADIDRLEISVNGDDHLCISEIELDINRQPPGVSVPQDYNYVAFQKTYGDANCVWVYNSQDTTNGRSLSFSFDDLRAYPGWNTVTPSGFGTSLLFGGFDRDGLIEMLNAIVGDAIDGAANFENGSPTTISRIPTPYNTNIDSDTDVDVTFHLSSSIFNSSAKLTLSLYPQWQCPDVYTGLTVGVQPSSGSVTVNIPILGYLMDLWVTPLSSFDIYVASSLVDAVAGPYTIDGSDIGFSGLNLPAPLHAAFPLSGLQVDGIGITNVDTHDGYPYCTACPCN
jgi:hypothetical protein